jgi:EAL domain-containing protein (putative c-di-GMP-specific phosphodiesterase class I)
MANTTLHDAGLPEERRARLELRRAAQTRGFALRFQPRVALHGGGLRAMQAQLRWPRCRGGMAATSAPLPQLEDGMAESTEIWALLDVCRAALGWPDTPVALALGGASLRHGRLLDHVGRALAQSGLPPERLEISVPAPALGAAGPALAGGADDEALLALAALRDAGVSVCVDGFGGSCACLAMLMRLPVTAVKFDRGLLRVAPHTADAAALMRAAIGFANAVHITTIATGLETAAQWAWLRQAGCEEAQGSFCSFPAGAPDTHDGYYPA